MSARLLKLNAAILFFSIGQTSMAMEGQPNVSVADIYREYFQSHNSGERDATGADPSWVEWAQGLYTAMTRTPVEHSRVKIAVRNLTLLRGSEGDQTQFISQILKTYQKPEYFRSTMSNELMKKLSSPGLATQAKIESILSYLETQSLVVGFEGLYVNNGKRLFQVIVTLAEKLNVFDTDKMAKHPQNATLRVEGYWASSADLNLDAYNGKYPFPTPNADKWPGQDDFVSKLAGIEAKIPMESYRGLAPSRLEDGVFVGNGEYSDFQARVIWPAGYREYYVEKFNVKPSREFFDYVMSFKE